MFRRLEAPCPASVSLTVDGHAISATEGDSVMAAMLLAGLLVTGRSPANGRLRAPYCGMGVCFECLVTVDGGPMRQACLTPVRQGMVVTTGADTDA